MISFVVWLEIFSFICLPHLFQWDSVRLSRIFRWATSSAVVLKRKPLSFGRYSNDSVQRSAVTLSLVVMGLWEDLVNASLRHSFFRATDRAVNKPSRKSGDADDAVIVTLIACKLSFCADISTLRPSSELIQLQLTVPAVFGVVTDTAWKMTGGPKRQQRKGVRVGTAAVYPLD